MKLPDIKNEKDEMQFWETHSIADYWEDLKESNDTFKRPRLTPVTIRFDPRGVPAPSLPPLSAGPVS